MSKSRNDDHIASQNTKAVFISKGGFLKNECLVDKTWNYEAVRDEEVLMDFSQTKKIRQLRKKQGF
ncbi:hypothetical protein ACTXT7_013459 [Hymenolepis weldensis]